MRAKMKRRDIGDLLLSGLSEPPSKGGPSPMQVGEGPPSQVITANPSGSHDWNREEPLKKAR
jgi:hypothetical protein